MADENQITNDMEKDVKMEDDVYINPFESSSSSKTHRGIIYLSKIPMGMNVSRIREAFSEYGEVDRIYLARDSKYCLDYIFGCHLGVPLIRNHQLFQNGMQSTLAQLASLG